MSKKSLFGVLSAMFLLVSCGGGATSEPAASSKEEQPASSQVAPTSSEAPAPSSSSAKPSSSSSSEAPAPTMTKTAIEIANEGGKVYAIAKGTAANYKAGELKFAWGFEHVNAVDGGEGFAYGSETPADADYKEAVTVAADGTYEAKFCLTDAGLQNGLYKVYAGAKGFYGTFAVADEVAISENIVKDGSYQYNYRKDEQCDSVAAVAIDLLPPIVLSEADVYTETDGTTWVKVGGELREKYASLTAPDASWKPFVNFQQVGGRWNNTRVQGDNLKWDFSTAGKAYLCANIDFFAAGTNYNTHINMTENRQQDCKMEVDIDKTVSSNGKLIQIYSNTKASTSDQNEFWGNLGFRVTKDNGIAATFDCDEHSSVAVYNTQDYTVDPVDATSAVSRDSVWGTPASDGTGQINFQVKVDEGYVVDTVTATPGTYKNIKLIDTEKNIWRITQVTAETTITIKTVAAGELVEEGFEGKFVHDDKVVVTVYPSQEVTGSNGVVTDTCLSRDSKSGKALKDGTGQINFRVKVAEGYTVDLTCFEITAADGSKGYNKISQDPDAAGLSDYFKITKVTADITIKITPIAVAR